MSVHQMEDMDHATNIVPTLMAHFTAAVSLDSLSLVICAMVRLL